MKIQTVFPFLFMFLSGPVTGQEAETAWPPAAADKVYTSLAAARLNPDSVYRLDLSRKKLKEVPEEVFLFKNLYELNLSRNQLTALPEQIGSLVNLKILKASNNRMKTLPSSIGRLQNLKILELNRNLLVTLPNEAGALVSLERLELWDNEIDSLPGTIKNLKNLQVLELRGILFTDDEQQHIMQLIPNCMVYFSPSCVCKD